MKTICLGILLASVVACASPNLAHNFKNEWQTTYFVFHYGDEVNRIKEIAQFSDGFITVVDREFFKANFQYPIDVFVLKDRTAFKKFLIEKAGVQNPPDWGMYLSHLHSFVTFEDSGYGTFAHEIMHPLVQTNLSHTPAWAEEGIPSFFEKSFGYWEGKDLVLHFGYHNPWRIKELGDNLKNLDLLGIIMNSHRYGTSEKRLISVFLYKHRHLKKFIELVGNNQKNGYDTFLEAAFERRMSQIEPLWKEYLRDIQANRNAILDIPGTNVLGTRDAFQQFMRTHKLKEDPNK